MSNQIKRKWRLITDTTPYIKSGDYISDEECSAFVRRLYAVKKYPILYIAIYPNILHKDKLQGFKVSSSYKHKSQDWWDNDSDNAVIPFELLDDVLEMLKEAKDIWIKKCTP